MEAGQGWAPMGARQLAEYALTHPGVLASEAVGGRYLSTWRDLVSLPTMKALVPAAVQHMKLLHAVDLFPRGARADAEAVPAPHAEQLPALFDCAPLGAPSVHPGRRHAPGMHRWPAPHRHRPRRRRACT